MQDKILIIGAGYVGLSYTCLLAPKYHVTIQEIDTEKVSLLKKHQSYISESLIQDRLIKYKDNISFYEDQKINDFKFIFICLPTNYDSLSNYFELDSLNEKLKHISQKKYENIIVIKSTVPVGYTKKIQKQFRDLNIIFSPEFLREGSPLFDALNPDRIIAGGKHKECFAYLSLIKECSSNNCDSLIMGPSEAEAVKLFSNTYLAMRVSFFNELDSFSINKELNTKEIIKGVCSDNRIGDYYNNPSFGYGGYCLPKDTKQLLANYENIPQDLISSIINSNKTRKKMIADLIIQKANKGPIGIYRLLMKKNADNFRESSIFSIIEMLKIAGCKIFIYEPKLKEKTFLGIDIENDLTKFLNSSILVIANRYDSILDGHKDKIFTRDIFKRD